MKAVLRFLFGVLSPKRTISYRTSALIGLSFTILAIALIIEVSSEAQEQAGNIERRVSKGAKEAKSANYDIRLNGAPAAETVIEKNKPGLKRSDVAAQARKQGARIGVGLSSLKKKSPKAEVDLSPLTGAVEVVQGTEGLSSPDHRSDGAAIVRDFLSNNKTLYGLDAADISDLNFIGESVSPESGLRMVRVEQIINGRPIFQSESRFVLDRDGRIIRSLGSMIPQAAEAASTLDGLLSPEEALVETMDPYGVRLDSTLMKRTRSKSDRFKVDINANDPNIGGDVTSKLVYFPIAPGVLVPAWSQVIFGKNEDWYVLVDARDGMLLWRKNIRSDASTHDARFRVYVQADGTTPADSPAPQSPSTALPGGGTQFTEIAPSIVTMFLAQSIAASPNGWIDDCPGGVCTANETQTLGNNVRACLDRDSNNICDTDPQGVLDGNGRPTGNLDSNGRNRDFLGTTLRDFQTNFLPPPQGGNAESGQTATGNGSNGSNALDGFRRGSVTQQFYNTNWYHDKLHALGFNQAAGNFQQNNFGGGGSQNDRVLVDVQDGGSTDNANFSTPPDGTSGRAQMYRFAGPTIDRDGGLDAEILFHELTHGTSNRLIGNGAGLSWDIGGGMGEGWSDFYALSLLNNTNADDPNGSYASGAYATYKLGGNPFLDNYVYGIRRFPYSTNNSINPMTWADVDQWTNNLSGGISPSPFSFNLNGALEVHNVGEIWALTLWEVRSRIIAANGGIVPTGNQIALQIVTDAMKLTPAQPSFLQARDALIAADCASNACANEESIWNGFADRGLGYGAKAPNVASFAPSAGHMGVVESFQAANLDLNTIAINDTNGNNSGFADPNEPVTVQVNLKNPWLNASKSATGITATISSSTPGVSILAPSTTYPNIAPNSNAGANGSALQIKAPQAAACGSRMNFTLTISSSLGVVARDFSIRLGQPSGTQPAVTYTRGNLGLAIQDDRPNGTKDSINIVDDYEIADLDVRIDSMTHTFDGDLTFGIRGPSGYGTDVLSLIGVTITGGGTGDGFVNTVFDDESANNVLAEPVGNAPYTKSLQPVFNSPSWATFSLVQAPPEATPQLSNFDGTSTQGTWTAIMADQAAADTGTWDGWSLIITPRAFTCTTFTDSVTVSGLVRDVKSAPIVGATVSLIQAGATLQSVQTDASGNYQFTNVALGSYVVSATKKPYIFTDQNIVVSNAITGLNFVGSIARRR